MLMLRLLRISFWVILIYAAANGTSALADTCTLDQNTCTAKGNVVVNGITLTNVCTKFTRVDNCTRSPAENSCSALVYNGDETRPVAGCKQIAKECVRFEAGQCNRYRYRYECVNGPANAAPAALLSREFINFKETTPDNCATLENDVNCSLERTITTEGSSTRNINLLNVTRSWWRRSKRYDCTRNDYKDNCGDYEGNPICTKVDFLCLDKAADGSCLYGEYTYECDADASFNANCEPINVCVGDNCQDVEQEASDDFPVAATWLNFLADAQEDNNCDANADVDADNFSMADCKNRTQTACEPDRNDPNYYVDQDVDLICSQQTIAAVEPQVFGGKLRGCNVNVVDCCENPSGLSCGNSERDLKTFRVNGVCYG